VKKKAYSLKLDGIKNIIFDLDGTLIDSSLGVTEATNFALEAMNEPPRSSDEIRHFIGYPLEEMFSAFSYKSYDVFWPLFRKKAREVIVASAEVLNDADRVLRELNGRGYNLAIGSTKISVHIAGILEKMGWQSLIQAYLGADQVTRVKPAPDVFQGLVEKLPGDGDETVVVGDTVNDVLAARAAGLKSIAVKSPYGREAELKESGPDVFVDRLLDILDILR
jgi:phosphoglycolate phosphatase